MAKPKAVPDASSRSSPAFWMKMVDAHAKRHEAVNKDYEMFVRWHRGDLSDVIDPQGISSSNTRRWEAGLENMTYLATVASLADLFFRFPRFSTKSTWCDDDTMNELAKYDGLILAHKLRQLNYRKKGRRALQDALLGPLGVLKITLDCEVAYDQEAIEAAEQEAVLEFEQFLQGVPIKAQEDQLHSVHIRVKEALTAQAERDGIPQIPKAGIKYMKKHIAHHASMKLSERPSEVVRNASIRMARVNPLDYFWDPTTDDRDNASWRSNRFMLRKTDVQLNDDYDPQARQQIGNTTDRWLTRTFMPRVKTPGSFDVPEEMIMVYEVFDFVDQKRRLFADGGTVMLREWDREDMAVLQPSGPFVEISFVDDCLEGNGIAPPKAYAGEQAAATHIAAANVAAAIESRAKTLFNQRDLPDSEVQKMRDARTGAYVGVDPKGPPDRKMEDMFAQIPKPEIHEQSIAIKMDCVRGIERRSGLGSPKMGGGDFANTATASAIVADASTSLSEDRGATVDEFSENVGRMVWRLNGYSVTLEEAVRICGPKVADIWPKKRPVLDLSNDMGVEVVPGSSRRRNTAVDQKQLLEGLAAFAQDPAMQSPAAQSIRVEMYRQYFEDGGVTGLPWGQLVEEVKFEAELQAAMREGGPQGPPGASGAPGGYSDQGGEDGSPAGSTEPNDMMQGMANVGGGRVPTGASAGDAPAGVAAVRGAAKSRVLNRV